ncbi:GRAS family protein RAD1 [Linum perenne]
METHHFGEEIRNIVAYEGSDRVERHERADQWRRQLGRAGFQVVDLKSMSQARMMLSVYGCDGYTLGSEKGFMMLGWKGRPIMLASAWQVHPHHQNSSSSGVAGSSSSSIMSLWGRE